MHFKSRLVCFLLLSLLLSLSMIFHLYYRTIISGHNLLVRDDKNLPQSTNNCSTIVHIAIVVGGYNATKYTATLLKTLLFYRQHSLHIHFIVDITSHQILSTLMKTWSLPSIDYTLYPITEGLLQKVQWIPNAHYSGVYGLIKLFLPYILSQIDNIIVLDTDLTILDDIGELWSQFEVLRTNKKWVGLVENQSDWYRGTIWKNHKPWPALGRGFNTGVMLLDLKAMRNNKWEYIWTNITTEVLVEYKYTSLADQDIINTVIKSRPDIIYALPCSWNIQLSDHTQSDLCYLKAQQYKIIHWNSPIKTQINHNHATSYFRNLHTGFEQYNGNLLRQNLLTCHSDNHNYIQNEIISDKKEACLSFLNKATTIHRTHLYYFGESYTSYDDHDITLVTQLSLDRVRNVHTLLLHWEGPMTLVLYCTDSELYEVTEYFNSFSTLSKRRNVAVHVVYKEGHLYPINILRNIGLRYTNTPYVFLTDIDFLPMFNLYNYLREAIKVLKLDALKRALVIPAFEFLQYRYDFPNSKLSLLKMLKRNCGSTIQEFRHTIWSNGHSATNYDKWYQATYPYKVHWAMDYEPYIAVHKNVTGYDEKFIGFGWNKVSHVMELFAQRYEFIVLPDAFIIHSPHGASLDITRYRMHRKYRKCLNELKKSFIKSLVEKYGKNARIFEKAYQQQFKK